MHDADVIELFLQGEGIREVTLIRVPRAGTVRDILAAAAAAGLTTTEDVAVSLEDADEPLELDASLVTVAVRHRCRVHAHRCRKVLVTVAFNGVDKQHAFPPATTIKRLKAWAVGKKGFDLSEVDATEHVLQLSGTADRPDEDVHIGALASRPQCSVSFDLVPKVRVEG